MSNRYHNLFSTLAERSEGAFVPFVTLCDPDLETSYKIITTLIDAGADALELGFPFSDPIADGPVIQLANIRALKAGATTADCFALIERVRSYCADIPIGLLLYSNLVMARSIDAFYTTARAAGVDSVLVADVPVRESQPFIKAATEHSIDPIFIAAPNSPDHTLKAVAELCQGYTYLLSRSGVTGTEMVAEMPADAMVSKLASFNSPPTLLGFGISNPTQVRNALACGAKGVISGSAVVKIIESEHHNPSVMLTKLRQFVSEMKAATRASA